LSDSSSSNLAGQIDLYLFQGRSGRIAGSIELSASQAGERGAKPVIQHDAADGPSASPTPPRGVVCANHNQRTLRHRSISTQSKPLSAGLEASRSEVALVLLSMSCSSPTCPNGTKLTSSDPLAAVYPADLLSTTHAQCVACAL